MQESSLELQSFLNSDLALSLGGGAIAGIAVGYALKSAFKLAMLVLGVLLLFLILLARAEIITVDWGQLSQGLEVGSAYAQNYVQIALKDLSAQLVGFTGGLYFGFKMR